MKALAKFEALADYKTIAEAPIAAKRKLLIQLYGMLFEKLGMPQRIAGTTRLIQQAPEAQIEIEIRTLETGQFQKVVHTLITCELTPEETDQVQALYQGIFNPYMEVIARGQPIPKEDLEWAYNEIYRCIENIRDKRQLPELKLQPKRLGKTSSVTKNISMTQVHRAWLEREADLQGVSISRVVQSLIDEKIKG